MGQYKGTFKCVIMTPDALLYQNEVNSLFLNGDRGEYELLAYHYPVLGILQEGNIIINWRESLYVKFGLVKFFANECIILVEEKEHVKKKKVKTEEGVAVDVDMESAIH